MKNLFPFLARLVAVHFTPVSESVSRWAEFRTSVAWSLLFPELFEETLTCREVDQPMYNYHPLYNVHLSPSLFCELFEYALLTYREVYQPLKQLSPSLFCELFEYTLLTYREVHPWQTGRT